jgi:probable phosphoglycerate mutase
MTYLLRHGQTPFSASYRVNGDPRLALFLDETGREQCRLVRSAIPVTEIQSCVTSDFPRAFQTAKLILEGVSVPVTTDWQLDELDYGAFEGRPFTEYAAWLGRHGPRARPPCATESQREGIRRMLEGLRSVLVLPGPRLVVTHGLALSVVAWRQQHALAPRDVMFPETPCATPVVFADAGMRTIIDALITDLDREAGQKTGGRRCCEGTQADGLLGSAAPGSCQNLRKTCSRPVLGRVTCS